MMKLKLHRLSAPCGRRAGTWFHGGVQADHAAVLIVQIRLLTAGSGARHLFLRNVQLFINFAARPLHTTRTCDGKF